MNRLPFHCPAQKTETVQTSTFCLKESPAVTQSLTWVFSFPFPGGVWAGASEQRGGHAGGGLAVPPGGLPAASTPRGSGDRPGALRAAWSQAQTVGRVGPQLTGTSVRASLPPCGHRHSNPLFCFFLRRVCSQLLCGPVLCFLQLVCEGTFALELGTRGRPTPSL